MSPATVSRLESGDRKGYGEIQALMYALLDTGARCTKLVTSTLDDPRDDCIPLRQTKGKRPRVVPLGRNTEQAIYRYLQRGRASLRPKSKALFVANNGGLLSRNAVRCVFHRLGDTLGFPISAAFGIRGRRCSCGKALIWRYYGSGEGGQTMTC